MPATPMRIPTLRIQGPGTAEAMAGSVEVKMSPQEAKSRTCDAPVESPRQDEIVLVDCVTKTFGSKTAVKDLSFGVPAGQICGLLGPNGAGKTTLFRLLMGILKATSGKLLVDGLDAFEDRVEAKRRIGYLPDEPIFYSYLSAREILELSAAMHGLNPRATLDRLEPMIGLLRLADDLGNF